jgi:hypothetical protein
MVMGMVEIYMNKTRLMIFQYKRVPGNIACLDRTPRYR